MTRILSPSQIACYAKCPQAWYLRYVDEVRAPTSPYASIGIWFHAVLEDAVLGLLDGVSLEDAAQAAAEAGLEEAEGRRVALAVKAHVEAFVRDLLPVLNPEAVEEWYEGTLGGYPVRCRVDYLDGGWVMDEYACDAPEMSVIDWKLTSKTTVNPEWVWEVAIQVALSGVDRGGVCLFDRSGKEIGPRIVWVADYTQREAVELAIEQVGRGIEAGNAPPLGAWTERYGTCACVYCDYVHVCRFGAPWRKAAEKAAERRKK